MSYPTQAPAELHLKDYTPPHYVFPSTHLRFEILAEDHVRVASRITVVPNGEGGLGELFLDGAPEHAPDGAETPTMVLESVMIDGKVWTDYTREGEMLVLHNVPHASFVLECVTHINPLANKALSGLYASGGKLVTQCESQGFRNITFYQDRPDILSRYHVEIIAPKGTYAQLLCNGNPVVRKDLADGRELAEWDDPFPKPSYLFALVAGNLAAVRDDFVTQSGRKVDLVIYTDAGDEPKVAHAMESLKQSMRWDEQRFGREYDLDLFQIVAVNDFNFGAMENKGLNIFNSTAILADPMTATDARYEYVQAVVGHEYFHNWSGNRVTCRDWFQLSLKEGLTVFRDAEFTADLNSRAVKRIDDVVDMRSVQFPEDASAMAHPIRPASVGSIENFYTPTVYEKGSEVIRMMHVMLGETVFRHGCDMYFDRHDGQAVTTEDFVQAMQDAANAAGLGLDLSQFEHTWYNQAGTPVLTVTDAYDAASQTYKLTIAQATPPTPNQPEKQPFHIPVRLGLLNRKGEDMPLVSDDVMGDVLHLRQAKQLFEFKQVAERPLPSLLRGWSAPVKLQYDYTRAQLAFLMAHDADGFNRWDAGQQLMTVLLKEQVTAYQQGVSVAVDRGVIDAFAAILAQKDADKALMARSLTLPSASYLAELYPDGHVDVDAIDYARKMLRQTIGQHLQPQFVEWFRGCQRTESHPYQWNMLDAGERAMKNTALAYLVAADADKYLSLALAQVATKHNITDMRSALGHVLNHADEATCQAVLDDFYQVHRHNPLVINQWFSDQAMADKVMVLNNVQNLLGHPSYDAKNPNAIRSLVGAFASNLVHFHRKDGEGYRFLAEQIVAIDRFNPMAAAGLTKRLATPQKYDHLRQQKMKDALEQVVNGASSRNTLEIARKSLALFT